ncbi:Growth-arrest-specific protein 2 domain protein [Kalmanozyma brasiliensis GHG001]|uniref:Growth-arrest-specific protein 2 domain protein n=1 Tax=Kalmanozyma brasiliensis (strain GHG001) TaxID=1365824 RepID=UPI00286804B7|nr:Growth-arrest-specific protein 2 domain protein [Kalmanozyma brasiliensis GHG001]KAF6766798.1 Growth-arrest-specific protein 2 domain protein [Kalmanozyma brasiliensis GHG001]
MEENQDSRTQADPEAARSGSNAAEVVNPDTSDRKRDQSSNHDQLSSEDFVELTRISRKKDDIERHIASLQSWPSWDPFKDVNSYSADPASLASSKTTIDAITSQLRDRQTDCDGLELDVQQFNLEDMKRLRSVAKAVSKRHLSGPDTDLLELALGTVFALDKLLRLLRERRTEHDLTDLRLQWEGLICSSWHEVVELRRAIDAFERRCEAATAAQPSMNGASAASAGPGEPEIAHTQGTSGLQQIPRSASSSSRLLSESLKLDCSRLVLRIRSFDAEKVRPAGRLLDLLIDQIQVPEGLIDEQEKLEDALPDPASIEAKSSQALSSLSHATHSVPRAQDAIKSFAVGPESEDPTSEEGTSVTDAASTTSSLAEPRKMPNDRARILKKTAIRSQKSSHLSLPMTHARHASNHYRSDPRDVLDVAVGNVVNRMPISVSIKNAKLVDSIAHQRPGTFKDFSGQYWIGEPEPRLCFCRILPSNLVMVRIGGGWQELSEFLTHNYAHLNLEGVQDDIALARGTNGKQAAKMTWMRSASGPASSPRARTQSSMGPLRPYAGPDLDNARHSSRIVTMPTVSTNAQATPQNIPSGHHIPSITRRPDPVEQRDGSFSTPCKISDLASSTSDSSIVIHSSSPSA